MNIRFLCIVIAGVVCASSGYAAERMITNDDLERKYAPDPSDVNKAWQWQQEKDKREAECAALKQDVAYARKAVHDENDPRPRNERTAEFTRINTYYMNRCVPDTR